MTHLTSKEIQELRERLQTMPPQLAVPAYQQLIALRNLAPALLSELLQLRKENERLRKVEEAVTDSGRLAYATFEFWAGDTKRKNGYADH